MELLGLRSNVAVVLIFYLALFIDCTELNLTAPKGPVAKISKYKIEYSCFSMAKLQMPLDLKRDQFKFWSTFGLCTLRTLVI